MTSQVLDDLGKVTFPQWFGLVLSVVPISVIIAICVKSQDVFLTIWALIGAALGYLVGVLSVPIDNKEKSSFSSYGKLISGFLTGYGFTKLESVINIIFVGDNSSPALIIANSDIQIRFLLFSLSFLIIILSVFNLRKYWVPTISELKRQDGIR